MSVAATLILKAMFMTTSKLKSETDRLIKEHSNDPFLYLLLVTTATALYNQNNAVSNQQILQYLRHSVRLKPMFVNQYQLASIIEKDIRIKARSAANDDECKEMIQLYLAAKEEEAKAACQLGSYLIDYPKDMLYVNDEQKDHLQYVETLLLFAHERKVPEAVSHLIYLYKRRKDYEKVTSFMKIRYLQTGNMQHLIELGLIFLNLGDYCGYCRTLKELGHPVKSVAKMLTPGSFIIASQTEDCCVCLMNKDKIRMLTCKHKVCDPCLLQMFENNLCECPQCRIPLCPKQNVDQKKWLANMMRQ